MGSDYTPAVVKLVDVLSSDIAMVLGFRE